MSVKLLMRRREFIALLRSDGVAACRACVAAAGRRRIGVLLPFAEGDSQGQARAAEQERALSC